jgi:hypothetical protein
MQFAVVQTIICLATMIVCSLQLYLEEIHYFKKTEFIGLGIMLAFHIWKTFIDLSKINIVFAIRN